MTHMFHNPTITVDGNRASGERYFEAAMTDIEGTAYWAQGKCEDEYRRVEDEWKTERTRTRYNYSTTYEGGWTDEVLTV